MNLLEVENLRTYFSTEAGVARAVDGVSFVLEEGASLALVGESACGKSVTALSIMRLIEPPSGYHPSGSIRFAGTDLLQADEATLEHIRGNRISMIFQEPLTALNPVFTIADQLCEPLLVHQKLQQTGRATRPPTTRADGDSSARGGDAQLSPPVVRWHAAAGHDCHGDCLVARA